MAEWFGLSRLSTAGPDARHASWMKQRQYRRKRFLVVTAASVLLTSACDPATDVAITNRCESSIWVRINGEEPPTEIRPGESLTTQRVGNSATVLWSRAQYGPVEVIEIRHKGSPVAIDDAACR